jgi:type 1 glutamine amidotransferase
MVGAIRSQGQEGMSAVEVLIITGQADLPYHKWQETTRCIRKILEKGSRFTVRVTEEPRGLNRASLKGYDVLILNYNGPRWPLETESAIESFVREGGGLIAFHHASYGPFFGHVFGENGWQDGEPGSGWSVFPDMIGATWAPEDIGHARRTVFRVDWTDPTHPISRGLPSFFVANDELYHRLQLHSGVRIVADALSPSDIGGTGRREPLAWTNEFGCGRVFFTTLGHDELAWSETGIANLILRGTEWAATGKVTVDPVVRGKRGISEETIRLLVVTGGHSYPVEFYSLLNSLPEVDWTHATSHAEAFARPIAARFDAVLLHDMHETTTESTRACLRQYVQAGGGLVSLHHAIVDYTDWPWWYEEVTGGKYFVEPVGDHPASRFKEGVEFLVSPVRGKERHPVLEGVGPLWVHDEVYKEMYHSRGIEVLMETTHPDNDPPVVYVGPFAEARILYVQLGHSADTMENPGFRRLISNAVRWVSGGDRLSP